MILSRHWCNSQYLRSPSTAIPVWFQTLGITAIQAAGNIWLHVQLRNKSGCFIRYLLPNDSLGVCMPLSVIRSRFRVSLRVVHLAFACLVSVVLSGFCVSPSVLYLKFATEKKAA